MNLNEFYQVNAIMSDQTFKNHLIRFYPDLSVDPDSLIFHNDFHKYMFNFEDGLIQG